MSGLFSFGHGSDAVMHGEFMGFVLDDESLLSLRGWAEKQGYPQASVQQGGPDIFAQMLESSAPPKMVIVDIDEQSDPVATVERLVSLCGTECRVIIAGSANDVTLYRRVLAAGAVEYLLKPLAPESLNQALAAALRAPTGANKPDSKEARIVVFVGARGGVGASTIALNAGWLMAHGMNRSVALFDLDLQFGTSSLALDLQPGRGLRDIVSSPNRVDSLMIASSIVPESENFSILGTEEPVDEVLAVDGSAISALLSEMKTNFDVIIIDMPRALFAMHKRLLVGAQDVVLVSEMTLAGIRDTLRMKNALSGLGSEARLTVVASRTTASETGHVNRNVFEKGMQGTIDYIVPEDDASLALAANNGKALGSVAPRAPVTKAIEKLASHLAGQDEPGAAKESASLWSKIIGKDGKEGHHKK